MTKPSDRRGAWIAAIRDSEISWRNLYLRGNSRRVVAIEEGPKVQALLASLRKRKCDTRLLSAALVLSTPEATEFFEKHLATLVRVIAHAQTTELTVSHDQVRGRVSVTRTLQARAKTGVDLSLFVSNTPLRTRDLPENHLLWFFLVFASRASTALAKRIGHRSALGRQFASISATASRVLRAQVWGASASWRRPTAVARLRALRSRHLGYRRLAFLYSLVEGCCLGTKRQALAALLERGWFEPISDDDLFELAILVRTLDSTEKVLGAGYHVKARLIASISGPVATFWSATSGHRVRVFYDQSPSAALKTQSQYLKLGAKYPALLIRPARPDIVIEVCGADSRRVFFVECKNSSDASYIRRSLYKCLGYIHDYGALWSSADTYSLRVVLAIPNAPTRSEAPSDLKDEVAIVGESELDTWAEVLRSACTSPS